jgi:putative nucleotidyltransferase with HDIG domain
MNKILFFIKYRYSTIYKILLFLLVLVLLVLFFPKTARFTYEYNQGFPWNYNSLRAPFDFAVLKTEAELKEERILLLADFYPYYKISTQSYDSILNSIQTSFEEHWSLKYPSEKRASKLKKNSIKLVESIFSHLHKKGIRNTIENKSNNGQVNLLYGNKAVIIPLSEVYTLTTAQSYILKEIENSQKNIDEVIVKNTLFDHLFQNVYFDEETTNKETESLLSGMSLSYGLVQKGELIISEGELVTAQKFQVLESLRLEFEKQFGGNREYIGTTVGHLIFLLFIFLSLIGYLLLFRREILDDSRKLLLLLVSITLFVIPESLILQYYPEYLLIFPLPLLAIIIRFFFDVRTAMFTYLLTVIMISTNIPNGYNFIFLQLLTGIITIISIYRLQKRSQFYVTSLYVFVSYLLLYIALLLVRDGSLLNFKMDTLYLLGLSASLTLFSYPIIYLFEKIFQQITVLSLLELSDTNNPILRKLAQNAPGTFQHSLQVGNLSEAALQEIGGNTLLVRAGALYHDIGKLLNPIYFIENQTSQVNPHNELSYDESAEIIIGHVTHGIKLAKKYRLPEIIIDFIRTHHGTRKVEYFYRLAKNEEGEDQIDKSIYTYPGPLPFSKETAVLMMADSIEAASRSIPKPDEDKLNNLVDQIISAQMESGQFDNVDITFRDIKRIKKIFKKMLLTIYHIRIEYPD